MTRDQRIRTTHVGSLVRPTELQHYITAIEGGVSVDGTAFNACLQKSIVEIVRQQAEAGIDIVSDGEFGKFRSWSWYILDRLEGFEERPRRNADGSPVTRGVLPQVGTKESRLFPQFYAEYFHKQGLTYPGIPACVGPITYKGQAALQRDIKHFKTALEGVIVAGAFMPVVAPGSAMPIYVDDHYRNEEKFLYALADALREEYSAIVAAGFQVQVDDAFLPFMWDLAFADQGLDKYRSWAQLRIDALNHALRDIPAEKIRYHICWGSFNTPHVCDIPLRSIVDLVLKVKAGAYCIEMANPRHENEWQVWKTTRLPEGRKLIPGVISHSTNVVEHPELIADRIVRLAQVVGRDNVIAGTDCGFAQGPHVQRVHPSIMWAKLESLAEGARLASSQLWG
jgi:5-methyltetrahydropteroyltriglutamate--homocysteine methyltransferase